MHNGLSAIASYLPPNSVATQSAQKIRSVFIGQKLARGQLISQSLRGSAVLHKVEGDQDNSRYWYRRAEKMEHFPDEPEAELAEIRREVAARA